MMRWHLALAAAAVLTAAAGSAAMADERSEAANALLNCAAIATDAERLACYDTAAGRLKAAMAPPSREKLISDFGAPANQQQQQQAASPPPQPQTQVAGQPRLTQTQPAQPSQTQTQSAAVAQEEDDDEVSLFGVTLFGKAKTEGEFGEEQVKKAADEQGLESITSLVSDFGYTPLGQAIVFLENGHVWRQTEGPKVRFPSDPQARRVTISKAMMGSYTMVVGDSNRAVRVRRVK
jgi:hypothetical protein